MAYSLSFLTLLIFLLTTACTNLDTLKQSLPENPKTFNEHLATYYSKLAQQETEQHNWKIAKHFSKKAASAINDEFILPEKTTSWKIRPEDQSTLKWARQRLTNVLSLKTQKQHPKQSALSQYLYDCWVVRQSQPWRQQDIEECRMNYLMEVASLESNFTTDIFLNSNSTTTTSHKPNIEFVKTPQKFTEDYQIYFDFASSRIDKNAHSIIDQIIYSTNNTQDYQLKISGHADKAGDNDTNYTISLDRANNVADSLISKGIKQNQIKIKAYGENLPAVNTPDGVPNRRNRRTEIQLTGTK